MTSPAEGLARLERFVRGWPQGCALVGGLAVGARVGVPNAAAAELVIVAPPPASNLLDHATASGYAYDAGDLEEWLAGGLVRLRGPEGDVDLIIADDPFLAELVHRATPAAVGEVSLPVATAEDLLLLELTSGSAVDLDDALAIKDALAPTLDRDYLGAQGARLDVDALRFLDSEG